MITLDHKMGILHDLWIDFSQDADWEDFFEAHDIGIPLAMLVVQGQALATEAGVKWIESDYDELCKELSIDFHGEYDSLEEMLEVAGYE